MLPESLASFRDFDEQTRQHHAHAHAGSEYQHHHHTGSPHTYYGSVALGSHSHSHHGHHHHGHSSVLSPRGAHAHNLPQNFFGLKYDYLMEERASLHLAVIQFCYGVLVQLFITLVLVLFCTYNEQLAGYILQHNANKWYWSLFTACSTFTNLGFSYWVEGLTLIKEIPSVALLLTFCVMAGNTCVPIFVRFCVWMVRNLSPQRTAPKHAQSLRCLFRVFTSFLFSPLFCCFSLLLAPLCNPSPPKQTSLKTRGDVRCTCSRRT